MYTAGHQLAQWLEATHPDFFAVLRGHVTRQRLAAQTRASYLRGFGDDSIDLSDTGVGDVLASTAVAPLDLSNADLGLPAGGMDFSDTGAIASEYTPASVDIATLDSSALQPAGLPELSAPLANTLSVSTDNSGSGLLTELGSGVAHAATSVGTFLTSSQGLTDMSKLASAYFQLQNNKVNAQTQSQVLQAQVARAARGQSPYPLSYAVGGNGQLLPIYGAAGVTALPPVLQSAVGAGVSRYVNTPYGAGYTVPPNVLGALGSGVSLTQLLPWLALFAGVVLLATELGRK